MTSSALFLYDAESVFNTFDKYMQITVLPQNGYFSAARRIFADAIFPEGRNMRDEAERAANTHPVTGLANLRAFERAVPTAEADSGTAFIFLDANNFGKVNKELTHADGNELLKNMAQVIKLAASAYGVSERCFALGGDEFAIICAKSAAADLRDLIESSYQPFTLPSGAVVSITGSIGDTVKDAESGLQQRKNYQKKMLAGGHG